MALLLFSDIPPSCFTPGQVVLLNLVNVYVLYEDPGGISGMTPFFSVLAIIAIWIP